MRREKVAGELQRPKGTWLNSYSCPLLVRNTVFALSLSETEGGKPSSPMESIEEVVYPGQWVSIFDGSCVRLSKIDTETQTTVLLPHHDHQRGPRTVGRADDVAGQHLLDLRHLLPSNSRVMSSIGLAERRPMGLNRVLQQRSTP